MPSGYRTGVYAPAHFFVTHALGLPYSDVVRPVWQDDTPMTMHSKVQNEKLNASVGKEHRGGRGRVRYVRYKFNHRLESLPESGRVLVIVYGVLVHS